MTSLCQLPELGLSCVGCCGHGFGDRAAVAAAIADNTRSWAAAVDRQAWGRRAGQALGGAGVCANVVFADWRVLCPLHPERNGGRDLRDPFCDRGHVCRTWLAFSGWDEARRRRFVDRLRALDLDWWAYSLAMESGRLLAEFEAEDGPALRQ